MSFGLFGTEAKERSLYLLVLLPDMKSSVFFFSGLGETEPLRAWAGGGGRWFSTVPTSSVGLGSVRA